MRVILDTNVLLSELISPNGIPARLIEAWLDRRFQFITHAIQFEEIRDVSRRDKIRALVRPAEVGRLVNQIVLVAEMPDSLPHVRRSPDPRDDFLLGLCEAGRADWLVTGDKDDLLASVISNRNDHSSLYSEERLLTRTPVPDAQTLPPLPHPPRPSLRYAERE